MTELASANKGAGGEAAVTTVPSSEPAPSEESATDGESAPSEESATGGESAPSEESATGGESAPSEESVIGGEPAPGGEAAVTEVPSEDAAATGEKDPLLRTSTLELEERDLEETPEGTTGAASPPSFPLAAQSTLELDEGDLEAPAPPPPAPPEESPLKPQTTLELDMKELEEVPSTAQAPPRTLRGRIAYPILDEEKTPLPSTLPPGVNEMAIAGKPPLPRRRPGALPTQTIQLRSIGKSRQRRRLLFFSAGLIVLLLVGLVSLSLLTQDPMTRESTPGGSLAGGGQDLGPPPPDLRMQVDLAVADAAHVDLALPDSAIPAGRVTRPPGGGSRAAVPAAIPDARVSLPSPEAIGEARNLYQQGLQLLLRGETNRAILLFNQALAQSASFSLAYRGLGLAYEKMGRKALARDAFGRYLILQPHAADAALVQKRIETLREGPQ